MKCKLCPMKKHCKDECYGENPCAFALAFDNLGRKIDRKTVCIESLKAELKEKNDLIAAARAKAGAHVPRFPANNSNRQGGVYNE